MNDSSAGGVRVGLVITGTELTTGRKTDLNGTWLSRTLRTMGITVAAIALVPDRVSDIRSALESLVDRGVDLIVTTGGTGPTRDDLTVPAVARFTGRELKVHHRLQREIGEAQRRERGGHVDGESEVWATAARKQAALPDGAIVLSPVGTAPGFVIPGRDSTPVVVVLPGPLDELMGMWTIALDTAPVRALLDLTTPVASRVIRLLGTEEELDRALEQIGHGGVALELLNLGIYSDGTGEVEIAAEFAPQDTEATTAFGSLLWGLARRFGDALFSQDGAPVEEIVAEWLHGRTVAIADLGTSGLLGARLARHRSTSSCVRAAIVARSLEDMVDVARIPEERLRRGASHHLAVALASQVAADSGAHFGIGIVPIEGFGPLVSPDAVGTVTVAVVTREYALDVIADREVDGNQGTTAAFTCSGGLASARQSTVTQALHLLRWLLQQTSRPTSE